MLPILLAVAISADEGLGVQREHAWETSLQLGIHVFRAPGDDQQLKNSINLDPRIGFRLFRPLLLELGLGLTPTGATQAPVSVFTVMPHLDADVDLAHGGDG